MQHMIDECFKTVILCLNQIPWNISETISTHSSKQRPCSILVNKNNPLANKISYLKLSDCWKNPLRNRDMGAYCRIRFFPQRKIVGKVPLAKPTQNFFKKSTLLFAAFFMTAHPENTNQMWRDLKVKKKYNPIFNHPERNVSVNKGLNRGKKRFFSHSKNAEEGGGSKISKPYSPTR